MSKNFELLQEIGSDEELFRTSDSEIAAAKLSVAAVASSLNVDNAERARVLRNASLPNVLVPVEDLPPSEPSPVAGSAAPTERTSETLDDAAIVSRQTSDTAFAPADIPIPPAGSTL